jgi:hypothetical protein
VAVVLRGVGKLTGGGFLEQMAELISDLNDLFGGFRERAERVAAAFRGPDVAYVMVTSPAPLAIKEIEYFVERLRDSGMRSDAFVLNRVHAMPPSRPTEDEVRRAIARHAIALGDDAPARIIRAIDEERALATQDARHAAEVEDIRARLSSGGAPLIRLPALPSDVHDVRTLLGIAAILCPSV